MMPMKPMMPPKKPSGAKGGKIKAALAPKPPMFGGGAMGGGSMGMPPGC